ncbi:hypothetical protein [Kingella potus]|nr:hypothetical protein [Kingella potus]UOP01393.1 hypothetical protein LVJ84_03965 [Kingella potus]
MRGKAKRPSENCFSDGLFVCAAPPYPHRLPPYCIRFFGTAPDSAAYGM